MYNVPTNKRLVTIICLILAPISGICIDMYAPSLPAISIYFHVTAAVSKLTITFCIIGFGLGQFIFGGLTDSYGRKKPLLFGLATFTITSLIIALTSNLYVLLLLRICQGFGVAAASVGIRTIIADVFEGDALTKITAYYAAIWAASPILAPIIGSYLQHYFGWQANFYGFTVIGILSLCLASLLPETSTYRHPFSPLHVLKSYVHILSNPAFLSGSISIGIGYAFLLIFSMIAPFLIIRDLGHSVVSYGHIAFFVGLMTFLGSLSTRFILNWLHASVLCAIAISTAIVAATGFLIVSNYITLNLYAFLIPVTLIALTESLYYPCYLSKLMSMYPKQRGTANASIGILLAIIPFVLSLIVSLIPLYTMLPASIIYFVLCVALFTLYMIFMRPLLRPKI